MSKKLIIIFFVFGQICLPLVASKELEEKTSGLEAITGPEKTCNYLYERLKKRASAKDSEKKYYDRMLASKLPVIYDRDVYHNRNALHYAVEKNYVDVIKYILDLNIGLELELASNDTNILHLAVFNPESLKVILDDCPQNSLNILLNQENNEGQTPLNLAKEYNDKSYQLLKDFKANNIENSSSSSSSSSQSTESSK